MKKKKVLVVRPEVSQMIALTKTQTALVIDSKGEATMCFGRDVKPKDKLQWPELMLASLFVAIGENDVAAISAAMEYAGVKLEPFKKEKKDAGKKVRVHSAGHVKRR